MNFDYSMYLHGRIGKLVAGVPGCRKDLRHIHSCIYAIHGLDEDKYYVGACSISHIRVVKGHSSHLGMVKGTDDHPLYNSMRKYGVDRFEYIVLESNVGPDLLIREQEWINKLRSNYAESGYNIRSGGPGGCGPNSPRDLKSIIRNRPISHDISLITDETRMTIENIVSNTNPTRVNHYTSKMLASLLSHGECNRRIVPIRVREFHRGVEWIRREYPELEKLLFYYKYKTGVYIFFTLNEFINTKPLIN